MMKQLLLIGLAAVGGFFGWKAWEKKLSDDEWKELAQKSPAMAAIVNNILTGQELTPGGIGDRQAANMAVAQLESGGYTHLADRVRNDAPALQE